MRKEQAGFRKEQGCTDRSSHCAASLNSALNGRGSCISILLTLRKPLTASTESWHMEEYRQQVLLKGEAHWCQVRKSTRVLPAMVQWGRPTGWTTWRPPYHCKETQTAVVWTCLLFIRSGPNHLVRHSERGKKTRQTEEEVGRHHQGMDRPGVCQVPEGSGEERNMEETGCEVMWSPSDPCSKGIDDDDDELCHRSFLQ